MAWVQKVKTVSTFPPAGTFALSALEIVDVMSKPHVSPLGIRSAVRMVQYFLNRAGHRLPEDRRAQLEEAKRLLRKQPEIKHPLVKFVNLPHNAFFVLQGKLYFKTSPTFYRQSVIGSPKQKMKDLNTEVGHVQGLEAEIP